MGCRLRLRPGGGWGSSGSLREALASEDGEENGGPARAVTSSGHGSGNGIGSPERKAARATDKLINKQLRNAQQTTARFASVPLYIWFICVYPGPCASPFLSRVLRPGGIRQGPSKVPPPGWVWLYTRPCRLPDKSRDPLSKRGRSWQRSGYGCLGLAPGSGSAG